MDMGHWLRTMTLDGIDSLDDDQEERPCCGLRHGRKEGGPASSWLEIVQAEGREDHMRLPLTSCGDLLEQRRVRNINLIASQLFDNVCEQRNADYMNSVHRVESSSLRSRSAF